MMIISLVRKLTIPRPVGFSRVPDGPHDASCPGFCGLLFVVSFAEMFAIFILRCPIIANATSSRVITASCVTHSYSDSGYKGRRPLPSDMTVHVRWGDLPPVSQQKTISPGTQGLVWI